MTLNIMTTDVVVVGGGPAGAAAATAAARMGAQVLLLERGAPSRDKLCSGVVAQHTMDLLHRLDLVPDLATCTLGHCIDTDVLFAHGHYLHRHRPYQMVSRSRFDFELREVAQRSGAQVLYGQTVRGIVEADDHVLVTTDGGPVAAKTVIGADGASGPVGRYVGPRPPAGVAMEAILPLDHARPSVLDFRLPNGYGWVFRKNAMMAVGIGYLRQGSPIRTGLARWAAEVGADVSSATGHMVPTVLRKVLRKGRVIVAGDAAGTVDPAIGEGIPWALATGYMAGVAAARFVGGDFIALAGYNIVCRRFIRRSHMPNRLMGVMRAGGLDPTPLAAHVPPLWRYFWWRLLEAPIRVPDPSSLSAVLRSTRFVPLMAHPKITL